MKLIFIIGTVSFILLASMTTIHAQINNAKTAAVKILGNTGAAKAIIEQQGTARKTAQVDWNQETNRATITYDTSKTTEDEILKRIALAGFDNEKFLAPDDVYARLPKADQYARTLKVRSKHQGMAEQVGYTKEPENMPTAPHSMDKRAAIAGKDTALTHLVNLYVALKDALVHTDAAGAADKASALQAAIKAVDKNKLTPAEHRTWMKIMNALTTDVAMIAKSMDVHKQRGAFASLSDTMYALVKVSSLESPIYYQHCPMYNEGKGAYWLSREKAVKNPFFGSQMMSCGSTVETLH